MSTNQSPSHTLAVRTLIRSVCSVVPGNFLMFHTTRFSVALYSDVCPKKNNTKRRSIQ